LGEYLDQHFVPLSSAVNQLDRQSQFNDLVAEYSQTFFATPEGKAHWLAYSRARQSAQQNYAAIAQLDAQGIDMTNAVLLKLLPHTDSEPHRAQGAWIHPAAFIKGDVRRWYEASGMTRADAWPTIARALWKLIQRVVTEPADLADACAEFAAEPATKGFQTGMVTPILNALRPEDFLLFNRKSRTTLNYFTGADHGHTMLEYPAANSALQQFIATQPALQQLNVRIAMQPGDLFEVVSHWLVTTRRFAFHTPAYWRLSLQDEPSLWAEWQEGGYVALSGDELGDVDDIAQNEFYARRNSLLDQYPTWRKRELNQVWRLAHHLREGDRLLVTDQRNHLLGHGTVTGPYYFVGELGLGHRRPVEWDDLTPRQAVLPDHRGLLKLQPDAFNAAILAPEYLPTPAPEDQPSQPDRTAVEPALKPKAISTKESASAYRTSSATQPLYTLADCAEATGIDEATLTAWTQAINRKGQAILYGPPGTGKTFIAHHLSRHLIGGGDGFSQLLQFHPAYSYEEFIQGLRPQPASAASNGLTFTLQPGRFLTFCREAAGRMGTCLLIIDEINRANLAQVLGELLYLLEYREAQVKLAGSETLFSIPANVRILGTMNTADRSIALVDNALRRRFAFLRVAPDFDVLRRYHARLGTAYPLDALIGLIHEINGAIGDPNFALGISYLLHANLAEELPSIWQVEIEPYLEEFFFDQPDQIAPFLWSTVKARLGY
jgi:hypothetical protein